MRPSACAANVFVAFRRSIHAALRSTCSASGLVPSTDRSSPTDISTHWSRSANVSTASRWPSSSPRHGVRSLSVDELLARLQDRFRLLRGSGRSTLDRQQTLRATVSWSYQLLTDEERLFFDRTSRVRRRLRLGCCRERLRVRSDRRARRHRPRHLVGRQVDDRGRSRRRLACAIDCWKRLRQYGEEQMELRGETALLRDRHAAHYAEVTAEFDLMVRGARLIGGRGDGCRSTGTTFAPLTCGHWRRARSRPRRAARRQQLRTLRVQHAQRTCRNGRANCAARRGMQSSVHGHPGHARASGSTFWETNPSRGVPLQRGLDVAPISRRSGHVDLLVRVCGSDSLHRIGISRGRRRLPTPSRGGGQHT